MKSFAITLALCLFGVTSIASAHGGGVDGQGGHNNRSAGNYHFHRGPLDGRTYASKEEAAKALSANSPGVANEAATDSNRSTELPLFDLAPYRPYQSADAQVIAHKAYTFQYNEAHEQAAWVLYRITAEQLQASVSRTDDFRRDGAVTTGSATLADYRSSGYDRGHLAAAAMASSQEVMSESFYLSNMSPQDPGFNRGIWRQLEARVRDWADLHGEVFVVTGPVLESELPTIGPNGVSVPAYYYKVVVDLRPPGVEGIGFILPNGSANQSIGRYAVSIDSVEAFTGIDFFPVVADSVEEEIEGNILGEHWGLEMGEVSTTRKLDSWGEIKAE